MYILCQTNLVPSLGWQIAQPIFINQHMDDYDLGGAAAIFETYTEAEEVAKMLMRDELQCETWIEEAVSECDTAFLSDEKQTGIVVVLLMKPTDFPAGKRKVK